MAQADRPRFPAVLDDERPRARQDRRGRPRHAAVAACRSSGPGRGPARRRPRRRRHRPRHDADELLRHRPPRRRRRRAGHRQPQPAALQRLQVQPPRGAAGLGRPRHRRCMEEKVAAGDLPPAAPAGAPRTADVFDGLPRARALLPRPAPAGAKRLKVVVDAANGMGTHLPADPRGAGHRARAALLRARRHLPQPRGQPAQAREPRTTCARRCARHGADLGVSFDGDADRAAFVDETRRADRQRPDDRAHRRRAARPRARQARALRPALVARGRRVHPRERRHAGARARRPLLHEGDAARARTASSAASSPATTTSATTTTPTARCWRWSRSSTSCARRASRISELVAPLLRYAKSPEINFEVEDKAGKIARARRALRRRPRSTTSTASPSSTPTGGSTSGPRTPSPSCGWWSRRRRPRSWRRRRRPGRDPRRAGVTAIARAEPGRLDVAGRALRSPPPARIKASCATRAPRAAGRRRAVSAARSLTGPRSSQSRRPPRRPARIRK